MSEPRRRRKSQSKSGQNRSKGNVDDAQDKLSSILRSVEGMQNQFTALSERMTAMESRFCHQEKADLHAVGEKSMDDDRLSLTASSQAEEHEFLGNMETSTIDGLHETPLAGSVPPLDDVVSPLEAVQSHNTHDNKSDSMFENNVDVNNTEAGDNLANTKSTSEFFDPEQTTTLRWAPTKEFGAFLEKNFRRRMTTDQVNEIVGELPPRLRRLCVSYSG